ncbi:MAG TPA: N-acetylmuramoyl-L-alanine amidase [Kofleriaceae bacterium]|nr:N-acetylmuramoyl-L-alanine amidase [Kofleriaceae bacterium]
MRQARTIHRRDSRRFALLSIAAMAALAGSPGCAGEEDEGADPQPPSPSSPSSPSSPGGSALDARFAAAAAEFGVPTVLLEAWAYAETGWSMIPGASELEGLEPAWGMLALRGARLERAAALAGEPLDAVRREVDAHLRAGAALLADLAAQQGIAAGDQLGAWAPAIAEASGIADPEAQAQFVHDQVYAAINLGAAVDLESGRLASIEPQDVEADFPAPRRGADRAVVDYPPAIWHASPNFNSRPSGTGAELVVIHTCEGNYAGCWSWLANSASGVSAHYVVAEFGEVSQLVRESNRAWHIAASYDCSLNDNVNCGRNGQSSNNFTIGIEHGGFASQSSFPGAQIDASAALACDISRDWGMPRDRNHFVGHGQLQPFNRTDPGPNWPWTTYVQKMNAACGTGGGGGEIIVDSNNANNDPAEAEVEVSASWTSSASTPGYYGSGYWFAETAAVSDGAVFRFHLDEAGARTIDAWWTSGANRSPSAPFVAFDASGNTLGSATRDQRSGGSQWNTVGTWNFSAGWNSVVVSRWTGSGAVVIADAIRVR